MFNFLISHQWNLKDFLYKNLCENFSHENVPGGGGCLIKKTLDQEIRKLAGQTYIADDDTIKVITFDGIQVKERLRFVRYFPQDPDVAF